MMIILAIAVATSQPQHAQADQPPLTPAQADVLAVERRWNAAVAARDATVVGGLISEDFRFIAPDGSVHARSAMLQMAADRDYVIEPFETQDVRVQVSGTLASITGCFTQSGTFQGQPFTATYRYVDLYRRQARRWVAYYAQAAQVRATGPACSGG
jgi:ketosteroid isomerase-like protein